MIVPVFPLPNTVFFPDTDLPLHVFEPRYREMIADVMEGDARLAVSLMDGDEFHSIATVGVVRDLNMLPDGRSTLRLEGESRVELTEMPSPSSYRLVRAAARPEIAPPPSEELDRARIGLIAALGMVFDDRTPFVTALNTVCSSLPIEAPIKQLLLEEDDLLRRHALATEHLDAVIESVMRHPTQLN